MRRADGETFVYVSMRDRGPRFKTVRRRRLVGEARVAVGNSDGVADPTPDERTADRQPARQDGQLATGQTRNAHTSGKPSSTAAPGPSETSPCPPDGRPISFAVSNFDGRDNGKAEATRSDPQRAGPHDWLYPASARTHGRNLLLENPLREGKAETNEACAEPIRRGLPSSCAA